TASTEPRNTSTVQSTASTETSTASTEASTMSTESPTTGSSSLCHQLNYYVQAAFAFEKFLVVIHEDQRFLYPDGDLTSTPTIGTPMGQIYTEMGGEVQAAFSNSTAGYYLMNGNIIFYPDVRVINFT
ncbi:unnamed protein product, partial [Owenia fusiformis]